MPLNAMMGIIPVAIGAGIALKVTEAAFGQARRQGCPTPGRKIRSQGRGRGLARGQGCGPVGRPYGYRRSGMGFGNFSNIGM